MAHAAPARQMTWWERVRTFEPALLRAILAALAVVLLAVGIDLTDVFGKVEVAWTAVFGVLPLIQGWWTRTAVSPASRVVETVNVDGAHLAGPASPLPTGTVVPPVERDTMFE